MGIPGDGVLPGEHVVTIGKQEPKNAGAQENTDDQRPYIDYVNFCQRNMPASRNRRYVPPWTQQGRAISFLNSTDHCHSYRACGLEIRQKLSCVSWLDAATFRDSVEKLLQRHCLVRSGFCDPSNQIGESPHLATDWLARRIPGDQAPSFSQGIRLERKEPILGSTGPTAAAEGQRCAHSQSHDQESAGDAVSHLGVTPASRCRHLPDCPTVEKQVA